MFEGYFIDKKFHGKFNIDKTIANKLHALCIKNKFLKIMNALQTSCIGNIFLFSIVLCLNNSVLEQRNYCKNFGIFFAILERDILPGPTAIINSTAASIMRSHSHPP